MPRNRASEESINYLRRLLYQQGDMGIRFGGENHDRSIEFYRNQPLLEMSQQEVDEAIRRHRGQDELAIINYSHHETIIPAASAATFAEAVDHAEIQRVRSEFEGELFRQMYMGDWSREIPVREYPRIELIETKADGVISLHLEMLSVKEYLTASDPAHYNVYAAANRTAVMDEVSVIGPNAFGFHRFVSFFDLEREIIFVRNEYSRRNEFIQRVPLCPYSPRAKFGIDIEQHPFCDDCRHWDDCCDLNGVYERQEELCQKEGHQSIVNIVLSNLKTSSGTKTLSNHW